MATKEKTAPDISIIPEGIYTCVLVDEKPSADMSRIIEKYWTYEEGMAVIAYNIHVEKCNFQSEPTELQLTNVKRLSELLL